MTESLYLFSTVAVVAAVLLVIYFPVRWLAQRIRLFFERYFSPANPLKGLLLSNDEDRAPDYSLADNLDRRFRVLVRQTGTSWAPGQVVAAMSLLAVAAAGLVYLLREDLALVAVAVTMAVLVPLLLLLFLRARWRSKVQNQMPDVYFLLARSLRAGLTLDQALTTAAQLGPLPMATELRQAVEQCNCGLAVTIALQNVARRLDMVDFDAFVMTVGLHRNVGGNLSLLLDRLAASVRDRNLFRGYFRAATALGRVTAIVLAIAAPLLFAGYMFWQPEFFSRFTATSTGCRMLGVAAGLEVFGCAWLAWLLRIDY
jgi:tight adherence protein B